MAKTILYIFLVGLLGFGVWFYLFREREYFDNSEAGFNVKDTLSIGKVFLARPTGEQVKLELKEGQWLLNDRYKARPASLSQMFYCLYKQEAVSPVPKATHNMVVSSLAVNSIKVELYDRTGKLMRKFYVGPEVGNTDGSYMLMEGSKVPYVVQIPKHNGYLSAFYEPIFKDWRDRSVFKVKADNLREVSVQYADQPIHSFTFKKEGDKMNVITAEPSFMKMQQLNQRRAVTYSRFFENVYSEVYMNGEFMLDSMLQDSKKRATITVTPIKGSPQSLDVYWMPIDRRSKNVGIDIEGVPEGYDGDRFYAVMKDMADTVVIQATTFDKILRKGFEFYTADNEAPKHQEHPNAFILKNHAPVK